MQYYIFDEVSPNRYAPYVELPDEIDLIETLKGNKPIFDELPIKMLCEIEEDEEIIYTDIINPGVPLFSQKMKSALDESGVKNIDYYPVELIDCETKELLSEYWLGIVTDIIPCIDIEKSTFEENVFGQTVLTKFCIDESRTKNLNLLRFHNIPGLIIINEELKEKLSKGDFQGVSFKNTDEYHRKI